MRVRFGGKNEKKKRLERGENLGSRLRLGYPDVGEIRKRVRDADQQESMLFVTFGVQSTRRKCGPSIRGDRGRFRGLLGGEMGVDLNERGQKS